MLQQLEGPDAGYVGQVDPLFLGAPLKDRFVGRRRRPWWERFRVESRGHYNKRLLLMVQGRGRLLSVPGIRC